MKKLDPTQTYYNVQVLSTVLAKSLGWRTDRKTPMRVEDILRHCIVKQPAYRMFLYRVSRGNQRMYALHEADLEMIANQQDLGMPDAQDRYDFVVRDTGEWTDHEEDLLYGAGKHIRKLLEEPRVYWCYGGWPRQEEVTSEMTEEEKAQLDEILEEANRGCIREEPTNNSDRLTTTGLVGNHSEQDSLDEEDGDEDGSRDGGVDSTSAPAEHPGQGWIHGSGCGRDDSHTDRRGTDGGCERLAVCGVSLQSSGGTDASQGTMGEGGVDMEIVDSSVQLFSNGEFKVRAMEHDGQVWFPATDTAEQLGYALARKAILDHCKEKGVLNWNVLTNGGKQSVKFINEANLYRLVMKSTLPTAEKFQDWVVEDVLPAIRKTGKYESKPVDELDKLQLMIDAMRKNRRDIDQIKTDVKVIEEMIPTKDDIKQGYNEAIKDKARHEGMPAYLIDLTGISKRLNHAINELVLRDAYDRLDHPRGSWLYTDKNGDVRPMESFEKDGIGETEMRFLDSITISHATELNYIALSPYVRNTDGKERRFYIKREISENDPIRFGKIIKKYEATRLTSIKPQGEQE